ncbi:VOC family protein [Micromonospora sp. NPDC049559]|uniref:VOC family protein n=1 Tax=Micromonospora sp. NPDC049559 TaxID=3155923 RepID=UPI003418ECAD
MVQMSRQRSVTPYVMVHSATAFMDFTRRTFDAEIRNVNHVSEDSELVLHAEAWIGDSPVFFGDSSAQGEQCQPPYRPGQDPATIQMWVNVPDAGETFARAVAAGATPVMEVEEQEDGRLGGVIDPFGTLWWFSTAN